MYVLLGCLYIYYSIYLEHLRFPSLCDEGTRHLIVHSLVYIANCYILLRVIIVSLYTSVAIYVQLTV